MKRKLLRSGAFVSAARKIIKRNTVLVKDLNIVLELLAEDAFDARLKTHKLHGRLNGFLACSAGYELRIVFRIIKQSNSEAILLEAIGSHEEVY